MVTKEQVMKYLKKNYKNIVAKISNIFDIYHIIKDLKNQHDLYR